MWTISEAVLTQYRIMTDGWADRHISTANTRLMHSTAQLNTKYEYELNLSGSMDSRLDYQQANINCKTTVPHDEVLAAHFSTLLLAVSVCEQSTFISKDHHQFTTNWRRTCQSKEHCANWRKEANWPSVSPSVHGAVWLPPHPAQSTSHIRQTTTEQNIMHQQYTSRSFMPVHHHKHTDVHDQ